MEDLKEILGIDLYNSSILDIDEENLIKLKECDGNVKNNFYFYLINELNKLENSTNNVKLSHGHFLMSYFLYVIFNPLLFEELSFYHGCKATKLSSSIKYKEWLLMFSLNPKGFINTYDTLKLAEEVLKENPSSEIGNIIISSF